GPRVLHAARNGIELCPRDFYDLNAARDRRGTADLVAQTCIGQAEHRAQLRIRVGVGRLALELETDRAVERDRLLEIPDDRAEVVAGAHDEARWRRCRGLSVREAGKEDHC